MKTKETVVVTRLSKMIPNGALYDLTEAVYELNDDEKNGLMLLDLKNPIITLILSIFVGEWGADRFYIEDHTWGMLKLLLRLLPTVMMVIFFLIFPIVLIPLLGLLIIFLWVVAAMVVAVASMVLSIGDIYFAYRKTKIKNWETVTEYLRDCKIGREFARYHESMRTPKDI